METEEDDMEVDDDLDLQSGIVRSRREVTESPPAMEPLLQCGEDGTLPGERDTTYMYCGMWFNYFGHIINYFLEFKNFETTLILCSLIIFLPQISCTLCL